MYFHAHVLDLVQSLVNIHAKYIASVIPHFNGCLTLSVLQLSAILDVCGLMQCKPKKPLKSHTYVLLRVNLLDSKYKVVCDLKYPLQ